MQLEATQDGLKATGPAAVGGIPAQLAVELDFKQGPPGQVVQRITATGRATAKQLGANDALRGLPLISTEDNLTAMIKAVQAAGAKPLLVGIQVPPNYGTDYMRRFSAVFEKVGAATKSPVVPFFLRDVADGPDAADMFQADRIHPLAKAHPRMLENVWPEIKKLIG